MRWHASVLEKIDGWRRQQIDAPSRTEAIRRLVEAALAGSQPTKARSARARSKAQELASAQLDKLIDPSAPDEERQQRKRRLLKGPKEFRDLRDEIRSKPKSWRLSDNWAIWHMRPHKFKVGELVAFNPAVSRFVPGGVYEVIKHLPGDGEYEYRIRNANEPHERVAWESELTRA
jgi:hypothetical protein